MRARLDHAGVPPSSWSPDPLPGEFGALEVRGILPEVDSADGAAADQLRRWLWDHGVLCLRFDQALTDEQHRHVVSMIGDLKDPIGVDRAGQPLRYGDAKQIIDSGFVLTEELRTQLGDGSLGGDDLRPGLFQFFHTDDSYVEEPAIATVLHARQLPGGGGGATCFIDMRAAYDLLDPTTRRRIAALRAVHRYDNGEAFPPRPSASGALDQLVEVSHPVVRAHPATGRLALYFDLDRACHVEGVDEVEGRSLLQRLQDHAEANAPRYCHEWQPHDVLIWDNASVQHRASSDFAVGEPRRFWRYMVAGSRPAGPTAR